MSNALYDPRNDPWPETELEYLPPRVAQPSGVCPNCGRLLEWTMIPEWGELKDNVWRSLGWQARCACGVECDFVVEETQS